MIAAWYSPVPLAPIGAASSSTPLSIEHSIGENSAARAAGASSSLVSGVGPLFLARCRVGWHQPSPKRSPGSRATRSAGARSSNGIIGRPSGVVPYERLSDLVVVVPETR